MPNYKADSYLRKSYTDDKTIESNSISNQRKLIEDFVSRNSDIVIAHERIDDGYSGIVFDRPAFKAMMDDIRSGAVNCIIVKDLSRLGREYIETFTYLRKLFPMWGVRFIAINDNIDTAKEAITEDLSISFKGVINDEYCRDISVKVRSALNAKRKSGDFVGAMTVYGYKKAENNKNQLVIDEYAGSIVRDIFKMRIGGYSAARIAEHLNKNGVLSPSEYKKFHGISQPAGGYCDRENAKWSATTIIRILKDEIYTGKLIQGKQGTPNYKIKTLINRPKEELFITENAHEPIVSRQDFDLVERLMQLDTRIPPKKDTLHLFSGILICGCCGNRMTRKTVSYKGHQYFYYYCPTGKKHGCTASNMIKEADLIACVTESVKAHIRNVAGLQEILNGVNSENINHEHCRKLTGKIQEVQKQFDKCREYKSSLYENYISGILSKDDYRELKKTYTQEGQRLSGVLQELETELDECMNNTSKKQQWIEHFLKFQNISELNRETVIQMIISIHIFDKTHLQITFNYNEQYEQALSEINQLKEAV